MSQNFMNLYKEIPIVNLGTLAFSNDSKYLIAGGGGDFSIFVYET
jgi:hypothetical protein